MRYLAVKDFAHFQHYSKRTPPWIKLYFSVLEDYAFLQLAEVTQRHLTMLWLVASRYDGFLPDDRRYLATAIKARGRVDWAALIDAGFLVEVDQAARDAALAAREQNASTDASVGRAAREQNASSRARPRARERESQSQSERENYASPPPPRARNALYCAGVVSRFPEELQPDVERLFARCPDADLWAAECTAWLEGLRAPPLSPELLAGAVREFLANGEEFAIRLFRGYLRKAGAPPTPPATGARPGRAPRPNAGAQGYANALAALQDLPPGDAA